MSWYFIHENELMENTFFCIDTIPFIPEITFYIQPNLFYLPRKIWLIQKCLHLSGLHVIYLSYKKIAFVYRKIILKYRLRNIVFARRSRETLRHHEMFFGLNYIKMVWKCEYIFRPLKIKGHNQFTRWWISFSNNAR